MYPIEFHKDRAEYLLDCIKNGHAIQPASDLGWTVLDLLTLAGVCHFAARSHGPLGYVQKYEGDLAQIQEALDKLHFEQREFVEEQLDADLLAAIGISSHLATLVEDGKFDQHFEPRVQAVVTQDITTGRKIIPLKGVKPEN